jgi:hypothetical protein
MGSLSYRGDLSSYSGAAYTTHTSPILQGDDGLLELDGSQVLGESVDQVVATLVFDVLAECDQSGTVQFEVGGLFPSEVGYGGSPISTTLENPAAYRFDDSAPLIGTNGNITRPADANLGGGCTGAVIEFAAPLATDNCTALPLVVCTPSSGSVFPIGLTTVTCVATDDCGNSSISTFDVEIEPVNAIEVSVQLAGVTGPVTRCIHFATDGCASVDVELLFVGSPATFVGEITVPCGAPNELTAKDEQHTLCDSTTISSSLDGTKYVADSMLVLEGGDTDNDGDVDINDLTWFLYQFGLVAEDGGCGYDDVTRDADFSNDGAVGSEDYTFLTANWLESFHCGCAIPLEETPGTPFERAFGSRIKLQLQASELPPLMRARLDRDGDGVFDYKDVRSLERLYALPSELSRKLERATRGR